MNCCVITQKMIGGADDNDVMGQGSEMVQGVMERRREGFDRISNIYEDGRRLARRCDDGNMHEVTTLGYNALTEVVSDLFVPSLTSIQ